MSCKVGVNDGIHNAAGIKMMTWARDDGRRH